MPRTTKRDVPCCSFCGKTNADVVKLIAGPGVYICDECVALCGEILATQPDPGDPGARQRGGPPAIKAWDGLADEELLAEMVRAHAAHENVERAVTLHVGALRGRGVSWARIGEALGMTRQSAWERFSGEE